MLKGRLPERERKEKHVRIMKAASTQVYSMYILKSVFKRPGKPSG